jgi:hypothetical protein
MTQFRYLLALGLFAAVVAAIPGPSGALFAQVAPEIQYEVLSPWAEADPVPLRGISQRLDSLAGKKIGVFANYKRAALPIAGSLIKRLNAMYPDSETSLFHSSEWNVTEIETEDRDKFIAWVRGVDAVVLVVGD